jgi:hypothetical protein
MSSSSDILAKLRASRLTPLPSIELDVGDANMKKMFDEIHAGHLQRIRGTWGVPTEGGPTQPGSRAGSMSAPTQLSTVDFIAAATNKDASPTASPRRTVPIVEGDANRMATPMKRLVADSHAMTQRSMETDVL